MEDEPTVQCTEYDLILMIIYPTRWSNRGEMERNVDNYHLRLSKRESIRTSPNWSQALHKRLGDLLIQTYDDKYCAMTAYTRKRISGDIFKIIYKQGKKERQKEKKTTDRYAETAERKQIIN